jgi:hypothetical protein
LQDVLYSLIPTARGSSVVIREARVLSPSGSSEYLAKTTLDTGANSGNYIGRSFVDKLDNVQLLPCRHVARLGDGATNLHIRHYVTLDIQLFYDDDRLTEPIEADFYVIDTLGDEAIIGLPDLLGSFYDFFADVMEGASGRRHKRLDADKMVKELGKLFLDFASELDSRYPSQKRLKSMVELAKKKGNWYRRSKELINQDPLVKRITTSDATYLCSAIHGCCYEDDRVEAVVSTLAQDPPIFDLDRNLVPGDTTEPWTKPSEPCPEEDETPDPLSFGEDILHFLEVPLAEAQQEYRDLLHSHVTDTMKVAAPEILDLLHSPDAIETFVPSSWAGLNVQPVDFKLKAPLPERMYNRPRPIRPELYEAAKQEYLRLAKYFYVDSDSPIASPLTIAPKATAPFIRFCGDFRRINEYIEIPIPAIPLVKYEIEKASKFHRFIDTDMRSSFHQIPLSEKASLMLSVVTPWGVKRPQFMPEGVGPASGILQDIVRDIFRDYEAWIIVIFDNFLICAYDDADAAAKFRLVLTRCRQYNLVLNMKKSWFGLDTVHFFGYEISHGKWCLSQARKDAINKIPFPSNAKAMQSFLGAALFFHYHVPDYSEWAARMYEMTHSSFVWDPGTWTFDYRSHFDKFKTALLTSSTLYFPDYSLPWVLRTDASEFAVGAVLFQIYTSPTGEIIHQPIGFASKRFSGPATKWDAYKREAYGIYFGVLEFAYYLRGKHFIAETDHRNLQWIESSQSPIVVRWRALLQSFNFLIRHIPGSVNRVADWLSRVDFDQPSLATLRTSTSFDELLGSIHGGRHLHYGASQTWERAKKAYPEANISIEAVRRFVRECPLCQKLRNTGIKGLPERILSLKPDTYRRTIGIDHVTVAPDRHGNVCVILLVEHFSHFPQAYAVSTYNAETVAKVLFRHYCTFGIFDQLASDPGSAFMSDVVKNLNSWIGVHQKVSLVGRHESNGCEGSGKQFLRHLTTLVHDERLVDNWSDDSVLPLINFAMASYPTSETGGIPPFTLKYGSADASYFKLPDDLSPGARAHELLKALDTNIRTVRELSLKLQRDIAEERRKAGEVPSQYEPGDLVLFNRREQPSDHLPSKLDPSWLGPYEVLSQCKNDVDCVHVNLRTKSVFHITRLKPFFGSYEQALVMARLDQNQFVIKSINYFTGNPLVRRSLSFSVTFDDGTTSHLNHSPDFASSAQFAAYVNSRPVLLPLRYSTAAQATKALIALNKLTITNLQLNTTVYLNLRYFDGVENAWFDSLNLPDPSADYVVLAEVNSFTSVRHIRVILHVPVYKQSYTLSHSHVAMFVHIQFRSSFIVVDHSFRSQYPRLFGLRAISPTLYC